MLGEDEALEVSPSWSGALLAVLARGVEIRSGESLLYDPSIRLEPQRSPLIGEAWVGEAFIDTGSRSARSTSGVEEGFILKTSILLRYWDGSDLEERILYPYSEGSPGFLLVRGDDRRRQASLYVAELAVALSLLQDSPPLPEPLEGPLLVVRHGSILQSLGAYFNEVFDLDRRTAEAILKYAGLERGLISDLIDASTVTRGIAERVNPGLLAVNILGELRARAEKGGHTVIGLTEDVSRGRHLVAKVLARVIRESIVEKRGRLLLRPQNLLDEVLVEYDRSWETECLAEFLPSGPRGSYQEASVYMAEVALQASSARDDSEAAAQELSTMSEENLVQTIYERQILKLFNIQSDSQLLLLYNYLFGAPGEDPHKASVELDKSWLYKPRILKSYQERIASTKDPPLTEKEIEEKTQGIALRYIFPESAPSCVEIGREAARLGVDRRVLADLIRVVPPLRVEYYAGDQRIMPALSHILAQSLVTTYGVPPQLLVVDSRSRINEWEYSALASLLEALSRRVAPYSTFIRDFSTRVRHIL